MACPDDDDDDDDDVRFEQCVKERKKERPSQNMFCLRLIIRF